MKNLSITQSKSQIRAGKIFCIGRNYAEHAKEMQSELTEKPVVFLKPTSALIFSGENIIFPNFSKDMHHEVELVVVIGKSGKNIPSSDAFSYILGYGIGLDMTLRDVQAEAKKKGLPWTVAKGFDTSAPISEIILKEHISDPHNLNIICRVNGEIRQKSNTGNMIFRIEKLIEYISGIFTLEEGDLIFTGTPEGVGPVYHGDMLEAEIENLIKISNYVTTE